MVDFNHACAMIEPYFKDVAVVLKQELEKKAFNVSDEEYRDIKAQYKFIGTLIQRIENEALESKQ